MPLENPVAEFVDPRRIWRRCLRLLLIAAGLILWCQLALAQTAYVFPGKLPPGCSGSGGTYTCAGGSLAYKDTITIASPKPATITVKGDLDTNTSSINATGATSDLTLIVTGVLTLGNQTVLTGNVTAGSIVDANGAVVITGSLAAVGGNIQLGYQTKVSGSVSSQKGSITAGSLVAVGGDVTSSGGGAISMDYQSSVKGSVTTNGTIKLGDEAKLSGQVTGGNGSVAIGFRGQVAGAITTAKGAISIANEAIASSCVSSTGSATITLNYMSKINSVCCGNSCSNTCVVNNTSLTMPKACAPTSKGPDHFELSVPASGVSCLASAVTLQACADTSSPCTNPYTAASGTTAVLGSSAGTLSATTVKFDAKGMASASLSHTSAKDGENVTVTQSGHQLSATNKPQCCVGGKCTVSDTCTTLFNTAGFIVSNAVGGAAVNVGTQTSGTQSATHYLRAVKTNTSTQACESALTGTAPVNFAYECNNPATCSGSNLMTVTGSSSATIPRYNAGSVGVGSAVNLAFDANGNAPFTFNFLDVGRVTLHASKDPGGTLLTKLSGNTNAYVTKPAQFLLSGIKQTAAPQLANPAAANASAAKFVKAGEAFSMTLTVVGSGGLATPNFGRESTPEFVRLIPTLVLPTGGNAGTLSNDLVGSPYGSTFVNGSVTVTNLSWSEVGVMSLTPLIGDVRYIGTSTVTGPSTGNIGRFYPHHFDTAVTQACTSGAFTYSGQPQTVQATAKNAANGTTTNYDGSGAAGVNFARAVTWSDANSVAGTVSPATLAATAFRLGVASGTPAFTFTNARTSPSVIRLRATDTDTASSASGTEGTANIRSGRLYVQNAYGSELLDLPMVAQAQYWNGSGYVLNAVDNCTALAVPASGSGMLSTPAALATKAPASLNGTATGSVPLLAGDARLKLTRPGAGNSGFVDVTLTAPVWLQFPWLASAGATSPVGRATFGIYKSPLIYRRENY